MARLAIVTVVTRNYAHFADVLLASCRRAHPDADLFACYADHPPAGWSHSFAAVSLIRGEQLGIEDWKTFAFQYTPFELSCALKPHVIQHVLKMGYDEVIYLDGDMVLYGPLVEVREALARSSIVITPHLLTQLPDDGCRPHERAFLVSGTFNAGFIAVRDDTEAHRFLDWWRGMVRRLCIVDLAGSVFVDQKWLDLVPGMFTAVHVLRHPGCNAGHWSLSQFRFEPLDDTTRTSSGLAVDGFPLLLFHFSNLTPSDPHAYLASQTRFSLDDVPALKRLVSEYHAELGAAGRHACEGLGCEFDTLTDGTKIHPAWREAIRQRHAACAGIANPFDTAAHPRLVAVYRSIERRSYKWRRDWRLKAFREQGLRGHVRRANERLKKVLRFIRAKAKSA